VQRLLKKDSRRTLFKQTEIGSIPEGWNLIRLGDIIQIKSGQYFRYNEFVKQGVRVLKIDNVSFGEVMWENFDYLPEEYLQKYDDILLREGDVVMALNRPIIDNKVKVAILKAGDAPCLLYQRVGKFNIVESFQITNEYLFHFFRSSLFRLQLLRICIGADQPYVNTTALVQIKIPLPPLKEQQKITAILSKVDYIIQKTDDIIEQTQRLKKALMRRLLTVGIGHIKFKEMKWLLGKQEIPEVWECAFLKDIVLSYKNGIYKTPEYYGRGFPSIRMFNIVDGRINASGAPLLDVTEEELTDYSLKVGDIIVNRVNTADLVGKIGIVKEDLGKVTFESKNIRIRVRHQKCIPEFLAYFMSTDLYYKQIRSSIKAAIGQATINQQDLNMIRVPLPPITEQQEIVSILSTTDLMKKTELKNKFYFQNLKKGLNQELLTGKIRVKV